VFYLYANNYRGFSDALIPFGSATFLVGENSTGKSSVLSLLELFANPGFWVTGDFRADPTVNLGGFSDMVSIAARDRKAFAVGLVHASPRGDASREAAPCEFTLFVFGSDPEGTPALLRCAEFTASQLVEFDLRPQRVRFRTSVHEGAGGDLEGTAGLLRAVVQGRRPRARRYSPVPNGVAGTMPVRVLLAIARARGQVIGPENLTTEALRFAHPLSGQTAFMAPIRTAPKRVYPGTQVSFTPEGDHAPYMLRSVMRSRADRRDALVDLLRAFGESSGLFRSVRVRELGRRSSGAFEIQIGLWESFLSVANVGYGVSQCLPLVVQMLTGPQGATIAMQQPEVHLHPRAQAALGELLHWMASERAHTYIVETHSDYIVDRFRLCVKRSGKPEDARVLFFERTAEGNVCHDLPIAPSGQYPENQPASFRDFFINEQIDLLGV
jgi:hypothetical protein